jgi:NAD(P)-dependent dehydrogenase (short-subunit alcohol dehydrogenase family)
VTGAGGTIGRAVVLEFARHGVTRIAGLDVSDKGLLETASVLSTAYPGVKFLPITADLTSEPVVANAISQVVNEFGAIHYAANNAGIGRPYGRTHKTETSFYNEVMDVNVKGIWLCQKYELEQMLRQEPRQINPSIPSVLERGSIIITSSVLGLRAMSDLSVYTTSKHAVLGLTKADAVDYASEGIRINAICPGFVDTPLLLESTRQSLASTIDRTPQKRLALPEEVAASVCFLASGLASHITGISLPVDGGLSAT